MRKTADIVAAGVLTKHADYLTINGWDVKHLATPRQASYDTDIVSLNGLRISCQVADTDELQMLGLQKHAGLSDGEGMVFPYDPPRRVSFHMASVPFPIDIVFVNSSSRISKIVENIDPGTPGSWGMSHTAMVVEVPGGFCRQNNISVGDEAGFYHEDELDRQAAAKYFDASKLAPEQLEKLKQQVQKALQIQRSGNLPKLPAEHRAKILWLLEMGAQPALGGIKMSADKIAQEEFPSYPRKDLNPKMGPPNPTHNRFKDRDLPDVTTDSQPMGSHYDQMQGFDPTEDLSDEVAPVRPSI